MKQNITDNPKLETLEAQDSEPTSPAMLKKQELTQQLQQINKQIMELRQQKAAIEDMIVVASDQGQRIMGALNLIAEMDW